VAITLDLQWNGAVGFIDWLDVHLSQMWNPSVEKRNENEKDAECPYDG
jgi:hypothetical protein